MNDHVSVTFIGGPSDLVRRLMRRCDLPRELRVPYCTQKAVYHEAEAPVFLEPQVARYRVHQVGRRTAVAVIEDAL